MKTIILFLNKLMISQINLYYLHVDYCHHLCYYSALVPSRLNHVLFDPNNLQFEIPYFQQTNDNSSWQKSNQKTSN